MKRNYKNENSIITVYDTEETIVDIIDSIKLMQSNGYLIEDYRVHGNNEAFIVEYSK